MRLSPVFPSGQAAGRPTYRPQATPKDILGRSRLNSIGPLKPIRLDMRLGPDNTVKTKINEKCAMSLDLPPLVRSGIFLLLYNFQSG